MFEDVSTCAVALGVDVVVRFVEVPVALVDVVRAAVPIVPPLAAVAIARVRASTGQGRTLQVEALYHEPKRARHARVVHKLAARVEVGVLLLQYARAATRAATRTARRAGVVKGELGGHLRRRDRVNHSHPRVRAGRGGELSALHDHDQEEDVGRLR